MSTSARILLVDDTPEVLQFLEARLRSLGFTTRIVHNGAQAIEAVAGDRPDLVVMDISMPEINGYQACREIKRLAANLPVLVLTAKTDPAHKFWALESGADDFLTKPIDPAVVVQHVRTLLGK
jgi:DNA-binding response OmpR family regulator